MTMTKTEYDEFLKAVRIGTLCSLDADGSPNAMPLWYDWDGEKIRMFTSRDTGKIRRLAKDPRACLAVAEPVGALEAWVTVEGTVEILDEGGRELACRLAALPPSTTSRRRPRRPSPSGKRRTTGCCSS